MVQVQPRLIEEYRGRIVSTMMEKFGYTSPMQVPVLEKIVLNQGLGKAISDKKIMESALEEMALITGQKPVV
ncbi:50S ribosomal protein L5, partial [Salibacteraceae bacterium]|nr:50S ribosomal protein L5 [Salibacteraceae bacterium]